MTLEKSIQVQMLECPSVGMINVDGSLGSLQMMASISLWTPPHDAHSEVFLGEKKKLLFESFILEIMSFEM